MHYILMGMFQNYMRPNWDVRALVGQSDQWLPQ